MRRRIRMKSTDFALIVGMSVLLICVLGVGLAKFMHDYERDTVQWDLQNTCIAHWVSKGVERSDIYRDGETCRIDRSFQ